ETLAERMEGGCDYCEAIYTLKTWAKVLGIAPQTFRKFLPDLQRIRLFEVRLEGETVQIKCPKLLELRDEYSRKSRHAPDGLRKDQKKKEESNQHQTRGGGGVIDMYHAMASRAEKRG
ncbi:MAG: hypothetical protein WD873_02880, partial [Candidatus Hydrogenedentales bacterium]